MVSKTQQHGTESIHLQEAVLRTHKQITHYLYNYTHAHTPTHLFINTHVTLTALLFLTMLSD